jgi:hypothetical protein
MAGFLKRKTGAFTKSRKRSSHVSKLCKQKRRSGASANWQSIGGPQPVRCNNKRLNPTKGRRFFGLVECFLKAFLGCQRKVRSIPLAG